MEVKQFREMEEMELLADAWDFTTWIDENHPEIYNEYVESKLKHIRK